MNNLSRIVVLISTYNGEKFLCEQLNSLLAQDAGSVDIFLRDDGSSDGTQKILNYYSQHYSNIRWFRGKSNIKPAHSFLELIQRVSTSYDFYFFCDQDDYWNPDKITSAISSFNNNITFPGLYYCATELVDENLNNIGKDYREYRYSSNLVYSFLRGSLITGCTICINRGLLNALRQYSPSPVLMHDSWVHLLCLSLGGVIIADPTPHIKYRQHTSNVLGIHKISLYNRLKNGLKRKTIYRDMASQIVENFHIENHEVYKFLLSFINYDNNFYNRISFLRYISKQNIELISKVYICLKIVFRLY